MQKDKGGMSLPCFQKYYFAAQLRPLVCLCSPTYTAGWKCIEGSTIRGLSHSALISDMKLQDKMNTSNENIHSVMFSAQNKMINCLQEEYSKILKWCAYDLSQTDKKIDFRSGLVRG